MKLLDDLKMYGRFAWGLSSYLRHPISIEQVRAHVFEVRDHDFDNRTRDLGAGRHIPGQARGASAHRPRQAVSTLRAGAGHATAGWHPGP